MASDQTITRELSLGEVVSKVFELYRRNFVTYLVLFLVIDVIFAAATVGIQEAASLPPLPTSPTPQQLSNWVSTNLGTLVLSLIAFLVVALVVFPVAEGATIKMASDEVRNRPSEIKASLSFAASRLLSMWALGIIAGILVILGVIALVIPGIILAIMFSMVLPALLLENSGVIGSLSRSRELVGHRWLKTFATFLVLVIIIAIISAILGLVSAPFGSASNFVSMILGALTAPILPIAMTVYYYSNLARTAPVQAGGAPYARPAAPPGMKFCTNCGAQLEASAVFCSKCGAKQPA